MSRELQPPVLSVSLVKIELPTVIKNEPLESGIVEIGIDDILDSSESEEEIISDVKDINIVYHPVCEESIKSEILERKHCKSVETQDWVKAENSPFIMTENITQRNKTGDTSDKIVTKGTGQAVVEVQGSNEYSNVLSKLEIDVPLVLNSSKHLNGISTRTGKAKQPEKTNLAKCYKIVETTSWKKDEEKIKVIKAPAISVEPHEYTSLAKDKYVCNHCQQPYNAWSSLRRHIKQMHRKLTTIYQCPYCSYYYKLKWNVKNHIILKHKDTKDIQWFLCNLCEMQFKLKNALTRHMKVHEQMQDGLDLKRYHCNNCDYKTDRRSDLKTHKLTHLKPEEIEYFYCYHCSYKAKRKGNLKEHIFRHFKNEHVGFDCYICNFMTPKRESIIKHIKKHSKVQKKNPKLMKEASILVIFWTLFTIYF